MDFGLFEEIVSQAADIGVKRIHLYLRGEPTLHPRIMEMMAFIKSKKLPLHLTTNGTTLTPERSAELLSTGVNSADQLTISFLGHSKEGHEATMVGVDHDGVVENILDLMSLRKRLRVNGPVVEAILNAPPQTQHEADDFLRFWRGKVDHARLGEISIEFQEYGREAVNEVTRTSACTGIFERLTVTWEGKVPHCNGDFDCKWILGDLSEDSITDIWNCERLQSVRRVHQTKPLNLDQLPMCLHCDM
jgi:radical SAM protein with 4Fe4S-binding SPASM domain